MNTRIKVDTKQYPIIVITPIDEPSIGDIKVFVHEMEKILLEREGKFIIISNNSSNVNLPVNIRLNLGKSLNYISGKYSERELAVFVVINSAFGRIMFSCISLIVRNNNINVVGSLEEAEIKANATLEKSAKANIL